MVELAPIHQQLIESVPVKVDARIESENVLYRHGGTELEGLLVGDTTERRVRPGVLILHDWSGVGPNVRMRATMLARLGYVAFAADLYGKGVRPTGAAASSEAKKYYDDLTLLRGRVEAGYRRLSADPRVDPDHIAVIGYCFGGAAALEFARTSVAASGIVSFHGALIVHDPSDAAQIRSPLLVLTGGSDPVVPDHVVTAFMDELRAAPDVDWQLIAYGGAPHAFTVPGSDRYRPLTDARSWRALVSFLREVFR
ncbi:MAG: dienelactone hydrolase family protein [Microbacteriaceae bacterium]